MYNYEEMMKVKYNNQLYRIVRRKDNKYGFLKIDENNEYSLPSCFEFLKLSTKFTNNRFKF